MQIMTTKFDSECMKYCSKDPWIWGDSAKIVLTLFFVKQLQDIIFVGSGIANGDYALPKQLPAVTIVLQMGQGNPYCHILFAGMKSFKNWKWVVFDILTS